MPEIRDTDWAYAAGFVDGEGCIAIARAFSPVRNRFYYTIQVVVANTDRSVLDWMKAAWGGHVVAVIQTQGDGRNSWTWRCGPGVARIFLVGVRPWLRIKHAQCDNALVMLELLLRSKRTLGPHPIPQAWLDEQEKLYWIQRELNHRGSSAFVAKASHSPRRIHRERLMDR
ncbi:MAG: hypothetical protein E6H86_07495 [Chloroflexi bacterium]|nr:MAG: hypothetical protein E6H86_07495 [Chloroflexota bacterium]